MKWIDAVRLVAQAPDDAIQDAAGKALDRIPQEEYRHLLIAELIADARRHQRTNTLRAERRAESPKRGMSGEEWRAWGQARREPGKAVSALPSHASSRDLLVATIATKAREFQMEWTDELLRSKFTLADGTRVAHGVATVPQHRERIGMFTEQAMISTHGAARHQRAIDDAEARFGHATITGKTDARCSCGAES